MSNDQLIRELDVNVRDAALARVEYVYKRYDHVYVGFSGGKDSLAVLLLARRALDNLGRTEEPVHLCFNDEEVIPDNVIEFVQSFRGKPGYELHYFAYPMKSHIALMGENKPYVQWDPNREWVRQPPEYAIRQIHPENVPLDQHEADAFICNALGWTGRICCLNGIRAEESRNRFVSCLLKDDGTHWIANRPRGIDFARPIYDWKTHDVFRWFWECKADYAPIYDTQLYSGDEFRVSTPLHDRSYKMLCKLRSSFPSFYEQILKIWPEVATQELYYKQLDRYGIIDNYPKGWQGIVKYIQEEIESPVNRAAAMKALKTSMKARAKNLRLSRFTANGMGGFPMLYVFKEIVAGKYMKGISTKLDQPNEAEIEYEAAAKLEAAS